MHALSRYLIVSGPTGSGKTEVAIRLAEELGGEIINADSVQVYEGHEVGAAAPSEKQKARVPHHLFGFLSGDTPFDVQQYFERAKELFLEVLERGRVPIFVGGSNLYLQALLEGLSALPSADAALRGKLESEDTTSLYERLEELDPERAGELHRNDRVRIVRALEIVLLSGQKFKEIVSSSIANPLPLPATVIVLLWERDALYNRLKVRSEAMVAGGLIEETKEMVERYGERWQAARTLGYAQTLGVLADPPRGAELSSEIEKATRNFAKRQMTFWRNAPAKFGWDTRPKETEPSVSIGDESGAPGRASERREGFRVLQLGQHQLCQELSRTVQLHPHQDESESRTSHELWYCHARSVLSEEP